MDRARSSGPGWLSRGSQSSTALAERATPHRSLTVHWKPTCPRGRGVAKESGACTHIVSLVKVDGAGDRCETLIPVMTVPVHS